MKFSNASYERQEGPVRANTLSTGSDLPDGVSVELPEGLPLVTDWLVGQDGRRVGLWLDCRLPFWARVKLAFRLVFGFGRRGSGWMLEPLVARDIAHRLNKSATHAQLKIQTEGSRKGWLDGP